MNTLAVVLEAPQRIAVRQIDLDPPKDGEIVVDIEWSGVSTGTERLLFTGRMPAFPGMGYPLVPSYEAVGRVASTGERVFVPGANCYGPIRGLFGGAAARLVAPSHRVVPIGEECGETGILFALAATAYHAIAGGEAPDLIVGHGALGRLIARLAIARGAPAPRVWETNPIRAGGAEGYSVLDPSEDERRDYRVVYDASGDAAIIDTLVGRLAKGGEIVLAGFYAERLSFAFAPAFMREARLRVAAEWSAADMEAVRGLVASGALSLEKLITHRRNASDAEGAYRIAFEDPACLKMILDWRAHA